ncbi:phage tail domain-containing protein [Micromonospora sp. CB01531]|uniref:phage tail domain-containing protein n=1 Tax=Micromonospora sp. CB01531 TaxID=1718947 RepID=UPI00093DDB65|nr:phage tail domain-containing protein [Micromonospora sp. CB01531]
MPRLQLESATDVLNLDDVLNKDVGVQALSGVAGLGLPQVSTQWLEGAGDGATYRGRRVLPRDIDIPIYVAAKDRLGLQGLLSRLAVMLAGEMTLRLVEADGSDWSTKVYRVGGGDYIYGVDTIGERDFQTVITLRAGDPFWTYSRASRKVIENSGAGRGLLKGLASMKVSASQAIGTITLENPGDAPAYPVWTVNGPGKDFKAYLGNGLGFHWTGTLAADETLTIDTRTGSVVDGTGANRYSAMAAAPRLWSVPPGTTTATASLENTSAGTVQGGTVVTRNLVTNPRFESLSGTTVTRTNLHPNPSVSSDNSNWTSLGGSNARSTEQSQSGSSSLKVTCNANLQGWGGNGSTLPGSVAAGDPIYGSVYVYPSKDMTVQAGVEFKDAANVKLNVVLGTATSVKANTWTRIGTYGGIAPANTSHVTVTCYTTASNGAAVSGDVMYLDAMLIEKAASMETYFDGNFSPSTIYTYRFTGTANASSSERLAPLAVGQSTSTDKPYTHCYAEGSAGSRYGRWRTLPGTPKPGWRVARSVALSRADVVAGQKYTFIARVRLSGWTARTMDFRLADGTATKAIMNPVLVPSIGSDWKDVRVTFTALNDGSLDAGIGLYVSLPPDAPATVDGYFDVAYWAVVTGDYTGEYFDGDTPDSQTVGVYDWSGTPHASVSTVSVPKIVGRSSITCSWRPRKWMVV